MIKIEVGLVLGGLVTRSPLTVLKVPDSNPGLGVDVC